MAASTDLFEAYAKWRELSQTEAAALVASNWSLVTQCQEAKRALQPLILARTEAAQEEWRLAGPAGAKAQSQLRARIAELMAIELANATAVSARRQACLNRKAELQRAHRNVGRIHRSYALQRPASWQSYS